MTYTAYVGQQDALMRFVAIGILDEWENRQRRILRLTEGGRLDWETIQEDGPTVEPSFRLPTEAARALLDTLTRYFNGAEDTRALRRDYDAERARVDKMIAGLLP